MTLCFPFEFALLSALLLSSGTSDTLLSPIVPRPNLSFELSASSVLEISPERRNRIEKFIRDGFFRGAVPSNVVVGAVVMISGAVSLCVSNLKWRLCLAERSRNATEWHVRRGMGGAFSAAACNFALAASWESEALRNLSMEKRRCLLESSGRARETEARGCSWAWVEATEMLSRGSSMGEIGEAGEGGTGEGGAGASSATDVRAAGKSEVDDSARMGGSFNGGTPGRASNSECRLISVSLPTLPRRRKNGMVGCRRVCARHSFPIRDARSRRRAHVAAVSLGVGVVMRIATGYPYR